LELYLWSWLGSCVNCGFHISHDLPIDSLHVSLSCLNCTMLVCFISMGPTGSCLEPFRHEFDPWHMKTTYMTVLCAGHTSKNIHSFFDLFQYVQCIYLLNIIHRVAFVPL